MPEDDERGNPNGSRTRGRTTPPIRRTENRTRHRNRNSDNDVIGMTETIETPGYAGVTVPDHAQKHDVIDMGELFETPYTGVKLMDPTSTAGPIGLLAFGIATVLLSLVNAGLFPLDSSIVMMGGYVGSAMVITGYMEWRKGNTFGAAAFATFGFFWLSFVGLLLLPKLDLAAAPSSTAMAAYLFMWALYAGVTFVATLKYNRALQFIFATVTVLFALLGLGYLTGNPLFTTLGGYEGVICGLSAVYTGFAQVLNEVYERTVAPLG